MPTDVQVALAGRCEAVEQELQAFSYIVSHDLAASLRQVSGFSQILLGELGEGLTGRQQSHADRIRAATDHCQAMIDQLLAYSRVQQRPLERAEIDPMPILRLAMLQRARLDDRECDVSIEPLGEVFADPGSLATIFGALLDNAATFRRPGVRPHIAIQRAHDGEFWRVQIKDNGPGIAPALREKVFQMFHTLDGGAEAVGAGLTLCRRIARRHGGEVRFLECATGACVELALPWEGQG